MGPAEEIETFDKLTLLGPRWFFRVVDTGNNEILAQSQSYKSKYQRDRTARRLGARMGCNVVPGKARRG